MCFSFYGLKIVTIALKNREWASKKIVNACTIVNTNINDISIYL